MDSKILCVSLLLAVFCFWSIEAGQLEDHNSKHLEEVDYDKGSEDTRGAINEHTAKVAGMTAKSYVNKAKAKDAEAKLYGQLTREKAYYAREYRSMSSKNKQRGVEMNQLATAEANRIGQHLARSREWESKSREARTTCKQVNQEIEELYTKSRDLRRSAIIAAAKAAISEAEATGTYLKAERAEDASRDLKRLAQTILGEAKQHYMKAKEEENKGSSQKVKAHQQAEDSQRHMAASKAYQQETLRTRIASRNNVIRYIQDSLLAQRHQCLRDINILKKEWSHKIAVENARISEECGAISKEYNRETVFYMQRARRDDNKSYEYAESKKLMGTEMAETGELLYMAQAKDESPENEVETQKLTVYNAEDPIKAMPSEDKNGMFEADEGMS